MSSSSNRRQKRRQSTSISAGTTRFWPRIGHVRDLPAKDGSVRPDEDFAMSWAVDTASRQAADRHRQGGQGRRRPDPRHRPGSRRRSHLLARAGGARSRSALLKDKPVSRVVFNAITKRRCSRRWPIRAQIDAPLVDAYLARRALDYLVGFTLSPVLWRKLPGARSAGRVQSVALRLVCDREAEIERFIREEYWQIAADLGTPRRREIRGRG